MTTLEGILLFIIIFLLLILGGIVFGVIKLVKFLMSFKGKGKGFSPIFFKNHDEKFGY